MKNVLNAALLLATILVSANTTAEDPRIPRAVLNDQTRKPDQMSLPTGTLIVSFNEERHNLKPPVFTEGPYLFAILSQATSSGTQIFLRGDTLKLSPDSGRFVPMISGSRVVGVRDDTGLLLVCNAIVLRNRVAQCWEVVEGGNSIAVGSID